jgi:hypothetical protein
MTHSQDRSLWWGGQNRYTFDRLAWRSWDLTETVIHKARATGPWRRNFQLARQPTGSALIPEKNIVTSLLPGTYFRAWRFGLDLSILAVLHR